MTYDKNRFVRISAADSLRIGRTEESLIRLKELMHDKNSLMQSYAAGSYFEVWLNCYGYHQNAYLAGRQNGLESIADMLKKEIESCGQDTFEKELWREIDRSVSALMNLITLRNQDFIRSILLSAADRLNDSLYLKQKIRNFLGEKMAVQVLVVDRENSYLSQAIEAIQAQKQDSCRFWSSGMNPGQEMEETAVAMVQEAYGTDMRKTQYPKRFNDLYFYDWIVPIGVKDTEKNFPMSHVIYRYENYETTGKEILEQIEEMIVVIKSEIEKERFKTGG